MPARTARILIGGAASVIFDEIVAGRVEELPRLLPELLYYVLVPYLGREAALQEARAAAARKQSVA
jgi:hypothetical protein